MKILFVCTGNTCRSPMAEAIMKKTAAGLNLDVKCMSAGISCFGGEKATENAVSVMKDMGIDLSEHVSGMITEELVKEADLILTMTERHKCAVIKFFGGEGKTYTVKEYACGISEDISDPFGGSKSVYKACAEELNKALKAVGEKLKQLK